MLYGDKREAYREEFFVTWQKQKNNEPLEPQQKRILHILLQHKEYLHLFEDKEKNVDKNFFPELGETNPFLHISLHLAILEQIAINQPKGIQNLYQQSVMRFGDTHEAEHCLMSSLMIGMHELAHGKSNFDEKKYLKRIKIAIRDGYWG